MRPIQIVVIQAVWNALIYALLVRWFVVPRLRPLPLQQALVPPILIHFIRPISLWTTAGDAIPGMHIHPGWAMSTAVGDLVAAGLALIAVVLLRAGARAAIPAVWIFNVVGFLDAAKNGVGGARLRIVDGAGPAAILIAYAVPALFVTHALIFWMLLRWRGDAREPTA